MTINKILKDQDALLKKASQSFKLQPVKIEDTKLLRTATEQRIAHTEQRLASLSKARDAALRRYDDAIAAEQKEVERLHEELEGIPRMPPETPLDTAKTTKRPRSRARGKRP